MNSNAAFCFPWCLWHSPSAVVILFFSPPLCLYCFSARLFCFFNFIFQPPTNFICYIFRLAKGLHNSNRHVSFVLHVYSSSHKQNMGELRFRASTVERFVVTGPFAVKRARFPYLCWRWNRRSYWRSSQARDCSYRFTPVWYRKLIDFRFSPAFLIISTRRKEERSERILRNRFWR